MKNNRKNRKLQFIRYKNSLRSLYKKYEIKLDIPKQTAIDFEDDSLKIASWFRISKEDLSLQSVNSSTYQPSKLDIINACRNEIEKLNYKILTPDCKDKC